MAHVLHDDRIEVGMHLADGVDVRRKAIAVDRAKRNPEASRGGSCRIPEDDDFPDVLGLDDGPDVCAELGNSPLLAVRARLTVPG